MAIVQVDFNGMTLCVVDKTVKHLAYGLFKTLDVGKIDAFRQHAREMDEGTIISPLWHPVTQDELITSGRGKEK